MSELNFDGFEPQTYSDWAKQLGKESKTGLEADKLQWEAASGLTMKAYYTAEDVKEYAWLESFFTSMLALRKQAGWKYLEQVKTSEALQANTDAKHALLFGAEALQFICQGLQVPDYLVLFRDLPLRSYPIWLQAEAPLLTQLSELVLRNNPGLHALHGGLCYDPLSELITRGKPLTEPDAALLAIFAKKFAEAPHFTTINISGLPYADAGGNAIQELAFTLAALVEYAQLLEPYGLSFANISGKTLVTLATDTHYYISIAKFRAIRILLAKLHNAYNMEPIWHQVVASTSTFTQTPQDPDTNILRNSTAALAAVVGNADYITLHPHQNAAEPQSNAARTARNIGNLLREEAYAGKTMDMAAGSYFLDSLTAQLSEAAWNLFREVEAQGGYLAAQKSGFIQKAVYSTQLIRVEAYKAQQEVLIGANKYALPGQAQSGKRAENETDNPLLLRPCRLAEC
jgi:methylmalonyl-CoA mutase